MMPRVPARRSRSIALALACACVAPVGTAAQAQTPAGSAPASPSAASSASAQAGSSAGSPALAASPATATAATLASSSKRAAAVAAAADPARAYFEKGIAAHDAGKLPEAAEQFERAWSLKKAWDIAANLGIVERKLGRFVAAAEHLSFALRELPPSESDRTRAGLEQELLPVLAVVGKLTIRSNVAGAEVRVGDEVKGVTPLAGPVFAAPGGALVELRKDGYEVAAQNLVVQKRGAHELTFELRPASAKDERSWAAPAIALGIGGVGLATGIVAGTVAVVKFGDLEKACGTDLVCPGRLRGEVETGRAVAQISTVGFVVAGLGAAVGLTLLALPGKSTQGRVGVTVGPAFVGVKGAF